jgi:hypothetical protein
LRQSRYAIRLLACKPGGNRGKDTTPLNNNRGNNRRRGRGNNRQQGGGQQLNRIDSRARGNAPQMLEKYRKLAHDAHLNGDRVQAEYYLQFADHYFRVIADQRVRQDEQRRPRDDRWQEGQEGERDEGDDGSDFTVDNDFPSFDQQPRREREDRPERAERPERSERPDRPERQDQPRRQPEQVERAVEASEPEDDGEASGANPYEPPENPFVRPNRGNRGLRPRREGREPRPVETADDEGSGPAFDPSSLPPAISVRTEEEEPQAPPKRRGRPRTRPVEDGDAEAVASVG